MFQKQQPKWASGETKKPILMIVLLIYRSPIGKSSRQVAFFQKNRGNNGNKKRLSIGDDDSDDWLAEFEKLALLELRK